MQAPATDTLDNSSPEERLPGDLKFKGKIGAAAGNGRRPPIAHCPASRANLCGNDEPAGLSHELHLK